MLALGCLPTRLSSQNPLVLRLDSQEGFGAPLAADRGAAGLRQRLLELGTTASVLHTTAHPDDEQSGLLTLLSRGTGTQQAALAIELYMIACGHAQRFRIEPVHLRGRQYFVER